jgi:hypothetical protein
MNLKLMMESMLCCRLDGAGWVMEWSGVETDLKVKMRHGKEFYQY